MSARPQAALCGLFPLLLVMLPCAALAGEQAVFPMQEVSVFEPSEGREGVQEVRSRLQGGQIVFCTRVPAEEVKAYPAFHSPRPLYGSVTLDKNEVDPGAGIKFHFAIDASGDAPSAGPETDEKASLLQSLTEALQGQGDAESDPASQYDRLYFDLNRDLDLTNDPPVAVMKEPPAPFATGSRQVVFDYLAVAFDHGPKLGPRPLRIVPRLIWAGVGDVAYMFFTAAVARQGTVRIGQREYDAVLAQPNSITGRFDRPFTALYLTPTDALSPYRLFRAEWLGTMREIDGQLYRFSATPSGDQLIVEPYSGELGRFEVGAGSRQIDPEKLTAGGVIVSDRGVVLVLGKPESLSSVKKSRQYELPVGDYTPLRLGIEFGSISTWLYPNRYSEYLSGRSSPKSPSYAIKIRKDKPAVFDLPNEPHVLFVSPGEEETFSLGDAVQMQAVLCDPALDFMIVALHDTTRKEGEIETVDGQGNRITYPRYASLDPTVVITNSSGNEVARGEMPFG